MDLQLPHPQQEAMMLLACERLGENVGYLVSGGYILWENSPLVISIPSEVIANRDSMLGALVMFRVLDECDGGLVVDKKWNGIVGGETSNFDKEGTKPDGFHERQPYTRPRCSKARSSAVSSTTN